MVKLKDYIIEISKNVHFKSCNSQNVRYAFLLTLNKFDSNDHSHSVIPINLLL